MQATMDSSNPLNTLDPNVTRLSPKRKTNSKLSVVSSEPPEKIKHNDLITATITNNDASPTQDDKPAVAGQSIAQRPRKRVIWRNKPCYIALPPDDENGQNGSRTSYLNSEEVERNLQLWQEMGYDIKGFVLAPDHLDMPSFVYQGQSRALHPDPADEEHERLSSYRVSIPNKQAWDSYVHRLKEEKLRNLGVTSSDDEPPSRKYPAPSLMSREASSQSSAMLTSPSLQEVSVSQNLYGPNYQLTGKQSNKPTVAHFPRYSVAMPYNDKAMHSSAHFTSALSPVHRNISPLAYLSSSSNSRGGSPSINEQLSNQAISSVTNTAPLAQRAVSPTPAYGLANGTQQISSGQQATPQHVIPEMPRTDPDDPKVQRSGGQLVAEHGYSTDRLATPIPHAHRQNPSETLQREVEAAETFSRDTDPLKPPLPLISGHVVKQAGLSSQVQSISNGQSSSANDQEPVVANSQRPVQHDSVSSVSSKLNVNAPEFKLEPQPSFTSDAFAFLPNQQAFNSPPPSFAQPANVTSHSRKVSVARPLPKLNAAAPSFTPSAAVASRPNVSSRIFSFGTDINTKVVNERSKDVVSREFSFSSNAPSFNPDAPAFRPSNAALNSSTKAGIGSLEGDRIFTAIPSSDSRSLQKKSRALPVAKPATVDATTGEAEGQEDESGRITQSDSRQKRMRRGQVDGDQVPQFAMPTNDDLQRMQTMSVQQAAVISPVDDGESTMMNAEIATSLLQEITEDQLGSESSLSPRGASDSHQQLLDVNLSGARKPNQNLPSNSSSSPPQSRSRKRAPIQNPSDVLDYEPSDAKIVTQLTSSSYPGQARRISRASRSRSNSYEGDLASGTPRHEIRRTSEERPHVRQDILDGMRHVQAPIDDIDDANLNDVMNHLNQYGDSDIGVERSPSIRARSSPEQHDGLSPREALQRSVARQLLPPPNLRSDAPSPSPNRLREPFRYLPSIDTESADSAVVKLVEENARYSPSFRPSRNSPRVQRLNSPGSSPPSDWNDGFSSVDETQLKSRTAFFDHRVDRLVGSIVQRRLSPLEKALAKIQSSMCDLTRPILGKQPSCRPRSSGTFEKDSDADDEDENGAEQSSQTRLKSPLKERKYEQLKSSINAIALAQQTSVSNAQFTELINIVSDLKTSISQAPRAGSPTPDVKIAVEEAVKKQIRGKSTPIVSSSQAAAAEKSQLQIAGLESMLKIAESRAEEELKARRATEDALADNQRLLRQALQEAAQQRESAEATEAKLQEYHEERQHHLKHRAMLEGLHDGLERTTADLDEKNKALEGTLAEYRLSHDQWRADIDSLRHENKDLQRKLLAMEEDLKAEEKEKNEIRTRLVKPSPRTGRNGTRKTKSIRAASSYSLHGSRLRHAQEKGSSWRLTG